MISFFKQGLLKKYANQFLFLTCLQDLLIAYSVAVFVNYTPPFSWQVLRLSAVYLALVFSVPFLFFLGNVYRSLRDQSFWVFIKRCFSAFCYLTVAFVFYSWIFGFDASSTMPDFIHWLGLTVLGVLVNRAIIYSVLNFLRQRKLNQRNVVIFGIEPFSSGLLKSVLAQLPSGYTVFSLLGSGKNTLSSGEQDFYKLKQEAIPDDLEAYVRDNGIDEFWIFSNLAAIDKLNQVLNKLYEVPINIRFFPDVSTFRLLNNSVTKIGNVHVINLVDSPMRGHKLILKNIEDKLLSFLILVLISPLLVCIAILVKLSSSGPVFFKQERVTCYGKKFNMLKFRSMPVDAEETTGAVWCKKNDNRPTKIGAFLRKTSLDELPQFINVLKGEMSIVGPRPERPIFIDRFKQEIPGYMQKHLMKAGITGWAQINGWRGDTDLSKRIEHDLYYIENWSLFFDLKIILLTFFKGFVNKNAY